MYLMTELLSKSKHYYYGTWQITVQITLYKKLFENSSTLDFFNIQHLNQTHDYKDISLVLEVLNISNYCTFHRSCTFASSNPFGKQQCKHAGRLALIWIYWGQTPTHCTTNFLPQLVLRRNFILFPSSFYQRKHHNVSLPMTWLRNYKNYLDVKIKI